MPCVYNLVRTSNHRVITCNLAPSIALTDPNDSDLTPELKVDLNLEKMLIYSDDGGWHWHKSWNLPPITLKIEIKSTVTGHRLKPPKNLYAELIAVKAVVENIENFHLIEIDLKGNNKVEVENGQASFTSLKFGSTSYNNDSAKFHLVVWLYLLGDREFPPKIISSLISPPIFVDSRKSSRDIQKIRAKRISSNIDPFLPDNLEKIFIKRQNKKKGIKQEEIENNLDGIANYFTAPNIRHKVKHPLFLAIKFSNCVSLFCNKNIFTQEMIDKFIESLQNLLYESQVKTRFPGNLKIEDKPLILALRYLHEENYFKNKKLIECLESINSNIIHVVYDIQIIPSNFIEIKNIVEIRKQYKKQYSIIASSKFRFAEIFKSDEFSHKKTSEIEDKNYENSIEEASKEEFSENEYYKKKVNPSGSTKAFRSSTLNAEADEEKSKDEKLAPRVTPKQLLLTNQTNESLELESKILSNSNNAEEEPQFQKKFHIQQNNTSFEQESNSINEFNRFPNSLAQVDLNKIEQKIVQNDPLILLENNQLAYGIGQTQNFPIFSPHYQHHNLMIKPEFFTGFNQTSSILGLSNEELSAKLARQNGLGMNRSSSVIINTPTIINPNPYIGLPIDPRILALLNNRVQNSNRPKFLGNFT